MSKNGFTPRQCLFIKNYIVTHNATKSAQLAGYSLKTSYSQGHRLLKNVEILRAVENGLAQQLENADVRAEQIVLELKRIAEWDHVNGNCPGNKMKALELLGEALGMFNKKADAEDNRGRRINRTALDNGRMGEKIPLFG